MPKLTKKDLQLTADSSTEFFKQLYTNLPLIKDEKFMKDFKKIATQKINKLFDDIQEEISIFDHKACLVNQKRLDNMKKIFIDDPEVSKKIELLKAQLMLKLKHNIIVDPTILQEVFDKTKNDKLSDFVIEPNPLPEASIQKLQKHGISKDDESIKLMVADYMLLLNYVKECSEGKTPRSFTLKNMEIVAKGQTINLESAIRGIEICQGMVDSIINEYSKQISENTTTVNLPPLGSKRMRR